MYHLLHKYSIVALIIIHQTHALRPQLSSAFFPSSVLFIGLVPLITVSVDVTCDAKSPESVCSETAQAVDAQTTADTGGIATAINTEGKVIDITEFTIDQLFTDLFDCGAILPGYEDSSVDYYYYDDEDESGDNDKDVTDNMTTDHTLEQDKIKRLRQMWELLREKYNREINLTAIDPAMKSETRAKQDAVGSVWTVPVEVGDAGPGKGRGVFASQPIRKGALVADLDTENVGIFKDGHSWRMFAASLEREVACNFIEWSWVQDIPPAHHDDDIRNGLTIFLAFDESNLVNNAEWDEEDGFTANIRCGSPPKSWTREEGPSTDGDGAEKWGACRFKYFASRDIAAGEELLINYSEFEDVSQVGWTKIGL